MIVDNLPQPKEVRSRNDLQPLELERIGDIREAGAALVWMGQGTVYRRYTSCALEDEERSEDSIVRDTGQWILPGHIEFTTDGPSSLSVRLEEPRIPKEVGKRRFLQGFGGRKVDQPTRFVPFSYGHKPVAVDNCLRIAQLDIPVDTRFSFAMAVSGLLVIGDPEAAPTACENVIAHSFGSRQWAEQ